MSMAVQRGFGGQYSSTCALHAMFDKSFMSFDGIVGGELMLWYELGCDLVEIRRIISFPSRGSSRFEC
jgi:hypothetical protein